LKGEELFICGLSIDWDGIDEDSYLRNIPAIADISELEFSSPVTFLVGENGTGKSTLLEAMAVAYGFNAEGGTRNYNFSTYDSHSKLSESLRLSKGFRRPAAGYFLRAESFYNVASAEEEYSRYGGVPLHLHEMSHGESFLRTAQNYFRDGGIYFMDEPEAALSPQRQMTMLLEISRCARHGAQFIIATHSPIIMAVPDCEILSFDGGRIHPVEYEDTDSYKITRMFINDRSRILYELLSGEEEEEMKNWRQETGEIDRGPY
jgi:predicted ATPase